MKRYLNPPSRELTNAAIEQMKITELRLGKVFADVFPKPKDAASEAHSGSVRRAGQILRHVAG